MEVGGHSHVLQFGGMLRCSVCHRSWELGEYYVPACDPVENASERPRPREEKVRGWNGPRDERRTGGRLGPRRA